MAQGGSEGGVFQTLGEAVGTVISWLSTLGAGIVDAFGDFLSGVAKGAGLHDAGLLSWAALLIGLAMVGSGIGGLLRGRLVGGVVVGLIGLGLIAWVVS